MAPEGEADNSNLLPALAKRWLRRHRNRYCLFDFPVCLSSQLGGSLRARKRPGGTGTRVNSWYPRAVKMPRPRAYTPLSKQLRSWRGVEIARNDIW